VSIDLAGNKADRIAITDMQGRELKNIVPAANAGVVHIAVNDLAAGIYFVRIQAAQGMLTRKIVVAK
jgi:type IX secretion system substrate protein